MVKEYATRDIKLETIRRSVEAASEIGLPAKREQLISECSVWWGLRRQSAQELLNVLEAGGAICINGADVWSAERWQKILEARNKEPKNIPDFKGIANEIKAMKEAEQSKL